MTKWTSRSDRSAVYLDEVLQISNEAWFCISPDIYFKADFGLLFRKPCVVFRSVGLISQNSDSPARDAIIQSDIGSVYVWVAEGENCQSRVLTTYLKCHYFQPNAHWALPDWLRGFPLTAISCYAPSSSFLYFHPLDLQRKQNREGENKMWETSFCEASLMFVVLLGKKRAGVVFFERASGGECRCQITFKKLFSGDVWDAL